MSTSIRSRPFRKNSKLKSPKRKNCWPGLPNSASCRPKRRTASVSATTLTSVFPLISTISKAPTVTALGCIEPKFRLWLPMLCRMSNGSWGIIRNLWNGPETGRLFSAVWTLVRTSSCLIGAIWGRKIRPSAGARFAFRWIAAPFCASR